MKLPRLPALMMVLPLVSLTAAALPARAANLAKRLAKNEPGTEVTVDLESRTITAKDVVARFQLDDYARWRLLEGLDDISLTLRHEASITEFEGSRPGFLPTTVS